MTVLRRSAWLWACAQCLASNNVLGVEPASVDIYGADLEPQFRLEQGYRDNVLYRSENELASWITIVNPEASLLMERGSVSFTGLLDIESGIYSDSPEDDYTDLLISGVADWDIDIRHALSLGLSRVDEHEDRGTAFSAGSLGFGLLEPDTYQDTMVRGKYRFGALSAKGRLYFSLENRSREYSSRREVTQFRDRDVQNASGKFLWRVGGRTDALAEVRFAKTDYSLKDPAANSLDNETRTYFIGASWDPTAKTEGSIRLGQSQIDFVSPLISDVSRVSWEISSRWSPKSYSTMNLKSARRAIDADGTGNFIDEKTLELSWKHAWTDRFRTTVSSRLIDRFYESDDPTATRDETATKLQFSMDYRIKRWSDVGFVVSHEEKDANILVYEYDSNFAALYLKLSL